MSGRISLPTSHMRGYTLDKHTLHANLDRSGVYKEVVIFLKVKQKSR